MTEIQNKLFAKSFSSKSEGATDDTPSKKVCEQIDNGFSYEVFSNIIKKRSKKNIHQDLHSDPKKKITFLKNQDMLLISKLYNSDTKMTRTLSLNSENPFIIFQIPSTTGLMINLFCCKFKMTDIYDKISTHGVIVEGHFNINPVTKKPNGHYSGRTLEGKPFKENFVNGKKPMEDSHYLIIDNHQILKILNGSELSNYKASGINLQCVEGKRLIENGIVVNDDNSGSMIVIAIDAHHNILIIHHPNISTSNMISFLLYLRIQNAINICDSTTPHIAWKNNSLDSKTEHFIGDVNEYVSNIIVFSS